MIRKGKEKYTIGSFIFARGGSQGIKKKNLALLSGKPLIEYSIKAAQRNVYIDDVFVSTDEQEIADIALKLGAKVPFIRPKELSENDTPELLAWQHALLFLKEEKLLPDIFISLPSTSPLRSDADISNSLETLVNSSAEICLSVSLSSRNPYFNMVKVDKDGYAQILIKPPKTIIRRQDAPNTYDITTVAYSGWSKYILNTKNLFDGKVITVEIPQERALDIDTPYDLKLAELLIKNS